ncbi:MAG: UTP--glucose-1-phosphate uridylyltransferase [Pirellulales bacterium]|nr:UTP--glucose-1-phosphate uridylyltransferase [Pirellulales bacterium]
MTAANDKQGLLSRLAPFDQQHLLQFWDELDAVQQNQLSEQIEAIDLQQIASLFRGEVDQPDWAELSRRAAPPPAVRLTERTGGAAGSLGIEPAAARKRAEQALRAGEVGVLLTAGGQGSRLGFDKPKGLFPIGPISGVSLLQIHVEKVRALAKRHGAPVPLYLMTSPATHDETMRFLAEHENFGLAEDDLFVFSQGTMPAVDQQTGKLLLSKKHKLFLSPDGHGGTVKALGASGALDHIHHRGIRQLFYFQVDNPLVPVCDLELLGYHLLAESELTSMAIAKEQPQDKVGNFAMIDGALHVIEYSDLPDEVAELRDDAGSLKFWAGSIAVHVFELALLERALQLTETLPFHVAEKKVPYVDATGQLVKPDQTNALKFERFIFDLLPAAERPVVVEYAEQDCFAPLKNAPGAPKDTAEYVQQMLLAQHRHWLEAAGARLADGAKVEISPLYALDAAGVAERVQPGQEFSDSQYLNG